MRGLRIVRGYVQVRIMHKGRYYHKNFGPDCSFARELAQIHLAEKRKEILMGKFGLELEMPSRKFKDLVPVYMKRWQEQRDGDGRFSHPPRSVKERQRVFDKVLIPFFGNMNAETVRTIDVERWRLARLATGVLGTSVNREMVPLGDMFSELERAVAVEAIPKFKLPEENPCKHATKAKMRKRERIPSDYELKKIKLACGTLGDTDGWEICKLALKSILSEGDLRKLELGSVIDIERGKTGVPIRLPITILQKLNWRGWRRRWRKIRKEAGIPDLQFRDLRKKGGNHLLGKFDMKLVSQYFGHANVRTTEASYTILEQEKMRPLAEEQEIWVEGL